MPFSYGPRSQRIMGDLHPDLQRLLALCAEELPDYFDISVTCSYRGKDEQNMAFRNGKSKKTWPNSAHNKMPADAFDFACYGRDADGKPVELYDREEMLMRQGAIRAVAYRHGIKLRKLIDWDQPHVERVTGGGVDVRD